MPSAGGHQYTKYAEILPKPEAFQHLGCSEQRVLSSWVMIPFVSTSPRRFNFLDTQCQVKSSPVAAVALPFFPFLSLSLLYSTLASLLCCCCVVHISSYHLAKRLSASRLHDIHQPHHLLPPTRPSSSSSSSAGPLTDAFCCFLLLNRFFFGRADNHIVCPPTGWAC